MVLKCSKEGHFPATCPQMKWWNHIYEKDRMSFYSDDEEASVQWLLKFTQDCPKCSAPIQKNGGCNHMSCRKCLHQYCWVCKDTWAASHYNCSKSDNSTDERSQIVNRLETNLSFRQHYLLHSKIRQTNDKEIKDSVIKLVQSLILNKPNLVVDHLMTLICRAIELGHLTRHIILHTCVLGNYLQEHSIRGSQSLKPEIQRLSSAISFLHSSLDTNWKNFTERDVELSITCIKTSIREFLQAMGGLFAEWKPKLEGALVYDKETLGIN